ncbi:hypothetical protein B9479_007756 [Cryptococcus floricola]|uniref:Uncharacterized protein n=1 Tax=Cryptococcus floricola TaxID=2591691 RepID=A0A5D3ALY7_9TREE|nr:hypothetical protein B9479_007756 [Cryptococcus floricola]
MSRTFNTSAISDRAFHRRTSTTVFFCGYVPVMVYDSSREEF